MPAVITQAGALNATALIVPDAYIQIVPPSVNFFNGQPTNIVGIVGTAAWGPVNVPVTIGSMQAYALQFGAIQNRKYDLGTQVATAVQQGANNFRCVRVTDGTDAAASVTLASLVASTETATVTGSATAGDVLSLTLTSASITGSPVTVSYAAKATDTTSSLAAGLAAAVNANAALQGAIVTAVAVANVVTVLFPASLSVTFAKNVTGTATETITLAAGTASTITGASLTSLYTGSLGNATQVTLSNGSSFTTANPTYKLTIAMPGVQEVFDNLGGTGNAFWLNLANSVNNGQSAIRGPSRLVLAGAGTNTASPVTGTSVMTGGTDGGSPVTVSAATLVGSPTAPVKGMYTLQNQGVSVAWLADADDSTQWANQLAFALANGIYMIGVTPQGDTPANAVIAKQNAGIDSPWWKHLFGDWVYWQDTTNNVLRLVSPQGFIGGLLGNLSPQNSTLNKPLYGVVGTQKSGQASATTNAYTMADLQTLGGVGIDVIANPCPGGSYFGAQFGHNSSSDATRHGDNYTRLTNYIAQTLGVAGGKFIGQLQTAQQQLNVKASLGAFFQSMQDSGQIGTSTGATAFKVNVPGAQSSPARIALGYEDVDVFVTYLSVVEFFNVNFQGGQSVVLPASANPNPGQ